jgi:hypothetical protein
MLDLESIFDPDRDWDGSRDGTEPWDGGNDTLGPDDLPEEWRALWEERAAIREYDAGLSREYAEALAWEEIRAMMLGGETREE